MRIRRSTGNGALLGVSVLAVLLAACSSDSTPARPSPAPSQSATAATTTGSPTELASRAAVAAWRGMWQDMAMAARTSDAESPLLGRYAAGKALDMLVSSLAADRREGVVARGGIVLTPRVSKVSLEQRPPTVEITDCGDDSDWLKYKQGTNELKNNVPGGRHAMGATVAQVGAGWKVVTFYAQEVGSC